MRILLTGGTGLIGKEIGKSLVTKGHEVVVVTRSPESTKRRCPYPHYSISWEFEQHKEVLETVEAVIHLAGENVGDRRWTAEYKNKILNLRSEKTSTLVKAMNTYAKNLGCFISTSGVGIYGHSDNELNESSPAADTFLSQVAVLTHSASTLTDL